MGTPNKSISVSVSGLQRFDTCHRMAYYASSSFGLGYSPVYERDSTMLGSLFHHARALIDTGTPQAEAIAETANRQGELWDKYARPNDADIITTNMAGLVEAHVKWQERDAGAFADCLLEIISVEQDIHFELDGFEFIFKCDRVVRHIPTGTLMPFEYKTSKYPENVEAGLPWDLQPRFYAYAVSKLYGEPVPGLIYDFIRACNPSKVNIIKDGLPSKAMSTLQTTTYEVYYDTLLECARNYIDKPPAKPKFGNVKEILEDYRPTLAKYKAGLVDPIMWRRPHWVTTMEQEEAARDMVRGAREMEAAKLEGADVRPTGLNRSACNNFGGCAYKAPCLVHSRGGGYIDVLNSDFIQLKERL